MAMRILQLGPLPPPHGGVQYNVVAIHKRLLSRGDSSEIINLTRHRGKDGNGFYYPENAFQLIRLLFRLEYDILHLHIGGNLTRRLLALSLICCLMRGSKAVLTFHSGGYPGSREGKTAAPGTVRGFIFRRFDGIIAVNEAIAGLFRKFGVDPERIRLILPYELPELDESVAVPEPIKGFMETHAPILSTVGLLEPEYVLQAQIEVLGRVLMSHPGAGLVIVGSGSVEGKLRELIRSKSYADHILLCGDVPHAATLHIIDRSDIFLRTTAYDGDAISVREALHLGVAVIATDTGMRPDGVTLIPLDDADALADAVERQLAAPETGRSRPEARSDNASAVCDFYTDLLYG